MMPTLSQGQTSESACWVWGNVDLSVYPDCRSWLFYQGDIHQYDDQAVFTKRGFNPYKLDPSVSVAAVIRLYALVDVDFVEAQINYLLAQWAYRGVSITHVQIDYDSPSRQLEQYAVFVQHLSARLKDITVSVTGLSSWVHDNPDGLRQLGQVADHVAMQLYQSYKPHKNYINIARDIAKLGIPYRLGITPSSQFNIGQLYQGQHYRGINLFLNR